MLAVQLSWCGLVGVLHVSFHCMHLGSADALASMVSRVCSNSSKSLFKFSSSSLNVCTSCYQVCLLASQAPNPLSTPTPKSKTLNPVMHDYRGHHQAQSQSANPSPQPQSSTFSQGLRILGLGVSLPTMTSQSLQLQDMLMSLAEGITKLRSNKSANFAARTDWASLLEIQRIRVEAFRV